MYTDYNRTQPVFTARLNVNNVKLDSDRIKSVGQKFAEYTRHYTGDVLHINNEPIKRDNGTVFYVLDFSSNKTSAGFVLDKNTFKKWFEETPVSDVAKSLANVFKYAKFKELKQYKFGGLLDNYKKVVAQADLNKSKYETTQNPIYKTLYERNTKRAKDIEAEIKRSDAYYETIENKIKDSQISNIINWWEEF